MAQLWSVTVDTTPPPRPDSAYAGPTAQRRLPPRSILPGPAWVRRSINLRVDGGVYDTSETSMLLTLGEGGHTWAVRSVDAAGNVSGYTGNWTVIVDTTPPPVPPLSSPENSSAGAITSVPFVWGDVGAASYDLRVVGDQPACELRTVSRFRGHNLDPHTCSTERIPGPCVRAMRWAMSASMPIPGR